MNSTPDPLTQERADLSALILGQPREAIAAHLNEVIVALAGLPPANDSTSGLEFLTRGWVPVRLYPRCKKPVGDDWQKARPTALEVLHWPEGNVGLNLEASGLVDVDLDCTEAIAAAAFYLPATWTFGRAGAPRSHWLYCGADTYMKRSDPLLRGNQKACLVELRAGEGKQTVAPGSVHKDAGEAIHWFDTPGGAPVNAPPDLTWRVQAIAAAALLARYWPAQGSRDDAALALCGALTRADWEDERIDRFIEAVATAAGCQDVRGKLGKAARTRSKQANGEPTTGWTKLGELLASEHGARICKCAAKWLGVEQKIDTAEILGVDLASDATAGRWFADRTRDRLQWVADTKRWIRWNGAFWEEANDTGAQALFESELATLAAPDDHNARLAVAAVTGRLGERRNRDNAVAMSRHHRFVETKDLDRGTELLLCTPTGTVDLTTGAVTPNDPARMITQCTGAPFAADASAPRWLAFLQEITGGDAALVGYLQRIAGYCSTGVIREHALFFLFGDGRNGKGTFVETVKAVLGSYATPAPEGLLLVRRAEVHPAELAALRGRRMVIASEVDQSARWNEARLTRLTGGDTLADRGMHENFSEHPPTHKILVMGNHRPHVTGITSAFWERMRLMPFVQSFTGGKADLRLPGKLLDEAPGILNWIIAGAAAYHRDGLGTVPAVVATATEAYRREQDTFGRFVQECLVLAAGASEERQVLRTRYEGWCREEGITYPLGATQMAERLRRLGVFENNPNGSTGDSNARKWYGVRCR